MLAYDADHRRSVPLFWSVAAVVVTGMLAAGATYFFTGSSTLPPGGALTASQATSAPEPAPSAASEDAPAEPAPSAASEDAPAEPTAAPTPPSDACATALAQADTVAQRSTEMERVLAEHTRIMEELLAQRLTAEQALDEALPVLTRGATERDRFRDELAAYESSRESCAD